VDRSLIPSPPLTELRTPLPERLLLVAVDTGSVLPETQVPDHVLSVVLLLVSPNPDLVLPTVTLVLQPPPPLPVFVNLALPPPIPYRELPPLLVLLMLTAVKSLPASVLSARLVMYLQLPLVSVLLVLVLVPTLAPFPLPLPPPLPEPVQLLPSLVAQFLLSLSPPSSSFWPLFSEK